MATPDEMIETASELTKKSVQVKDRRYDNFTPKEIIEAAQLIDARTAPNGPLLRVGFRGRVT